MTIRKSIHSVFTGLVMSIFVHASVSTAAQMEEKQKTPDVVLKSPSGESIPLASYLGKKTVLLVFWASWCNDCRDEIPLLKKLNAERFKVIAVNEGESAWKTKRFIAMNNIDYQVFLDSDGSVAKAFQIPGVPACAILNTAGMIVYRGTGLPDNIDSYAGK
jgi:peroxiredoxin